MRTKHLLPYLLLSLSLSASSCGSLVYRHGVLRYGDPEPLFFTGVRYDYLFVVGEMSHGEPDWLSRGFRVIDMPLSLAMDVVLLPFDTVVWFLWQPEDVEETEPRRKD